jgi:hypothetical protein
MVVHIPSIVGKLLTQGSLVAAFVLACTLNPKGWIRPNVLLGLFSLLATTSLMMSLRFVSLGTAVRGFRLVAFLVVLWMLTPWWGRTDLVLLRSHLRVLGVILGSVVLGAAISHHKAFSYGGRLTGTIWPMPPTQVAHYAAETTGIALVMWMTGLVTRKTALYIAVPSLAVLLLTHTRTALIGLAVGLLVAALSLFTSRRRVRKWFAALALAAAVAGPGAAPLISAWLTRGESVQQISDLSGRTKVWTLVLHNQRPLTERVLGSGLSNESFDGLSIDSTWITSFQDQGIVGDVIDAAMLLFLLVLAALFRPRGPTRALALFLIVYCVIATFTETGVGEATTYMLDLAVAASLLALPAGNGDLHAERVRA